MKSILLVAALASCAATSAGAGVIHGVLKVPSAVPAAAAAANPYPGRAGSLHSARAVTRGDVTDAVVYVDRVPAAAESALARTRQDLPRLSQKEQAFAPRVIVVAAGTSVEFPNLDPIYHNVFSPSPAKRFDLGKYPRGTSKRVVFNKPGLVNVFCDIHSDMAAFVLVLPHHGFSRPRETGAFALPSLPAGRYLLKAWHPDLGETSRTIEIPARGDATADLSF